MERTKYASKDFSMQLTKALNFKGAAAHYTASMFGVTSEESRSPTDACENLFLKLYQTRDAVTRLSADMLTQKAVELFDQIEAFVPKKERE